jgi:hypothetical protein
MPTAHPAQQPRASASAGYEARGLVRLWVRAAKRSPTACRGSTFVPVQLAARVIDGGAPALTSQPIDGGGMVLRSLELVEPIVAHIRPTGRSLL